MGQTAPPFYECIRIQIPQFSEKSPQFSIPNYQRTCSWSWEDCGQLWDDIVRAGKNDKADSHFMGSIVYIKKGQSQVSLQSPWLVKPLRVSLNVAFHEVEDARPL